MINCETIEFIRLLNYFTEKFKDYDCIKEFEEATLMNSWRYIFYDKDRPDKVHYPDGYDIAYPVVESMYVDKTHHDIYRFYGTDEYDVRVIFDEEEKPFINIRMKENGKNIIVMPGTWFIQGGVL